MQLAAVALLIVCASHVSLAGPFSKRSSRFEPDDVPVRDEDIDDDSANPFADKNPDRSGLAPTEEPSNPTQYHFGYEIDDGSGNSQHRAEKSDANGAKVNDVHN